MWRVRLSTTTKRTIVVLDGIIGEGKAIEIAQRVACVGATLPNKCEIIPPGVIERVWWEEEKWEEERK